MRTNVAKGNAEHHGGPSRELAGSFSEFDCKRIDADPTHGIDFVGVRCDFARNAADEHVIVFVLAKPRFEFGAIRECAELTQVNRFATEFLANAAISGVEDGFSHTGVRTTRICPKSA